MITPPTKNRFIGTASKKNTKFLDLDLEISKLTINQVLRIQAVTKAAVDDEHSNILVLSEVIRAGAEELRTLTQEELQDFPMEELATLSNTIMEFSGLVAAT